MSILQVSRLTRRFGWEPADVPVSPPDAPCVLEQWR